MFGKSNAKNVKQNEDKTSPTTAPQNQMQGAETKGKSVEGKSTRKGKTPAKASSKAKNGRGQRSTKTRNETAVSLDLGSREIKGVYGKVEGRKIILQNIFKGEVENGWYQDGRISNTEAGKTNILDILRKNKIKNTKAICTIESADIIKREIIVPRVEEKDILPLINYEIGQYLPIDINAYVIQYKVLDEFIENDVKKMQLLVTAMPKPMAEGLFRLVQGCQLTPYALDVHFNSLEKLIQMEIASGEDGKKNWAKNIALVDFGIKKTNVTLFSNGKYVFNSIIDYGERNLHDIVKNKCNQADKLELEEIHNILDGMFVPLKQQAVHAGLGNNGAMNMPQVQGQVMQQAVPSSNPQAVQQGMQAMQQSTVNSGYPQERQQGMQQPYPQGQQQGMQQPYPQGQQQGMQQPYPQGYQQGMQQQAMQQPYPQGYPQQNGPSMLTPFDMPAINNGMFGERKAGLLPEGAETIVQATGIASLRETYMKFSDIFELNQSLIASITQLADEIDKTTRYFAMRKVQNHVEKIYVYGGNSKIEGLEKFLENRFDISTESLPRLYCVEINQNKDFDFSQYLNALGAIIRL